MAMVYDCGKCANDNILLYIGFIKGSLGSYKFKYIMVKIIVIIHVFFFLKKKANFTVII